MREVSERAGSGGVAAVFVPAFCVFAERAECYRTAAADAMKEGTVVRDETCGFKEVWHEKR